MTGFSWGSSVIRGIALSLILIFVSGCGVESTSTSGGNSAIPTYQGPQVSYCSTVTSYSSGIVTISGDAEYYRREPFGNELAGGLGPAGAAHPIRHAEVRVSDPSGTIIQCTETLADGTFTFVVPQAASGIYAVNVTSRADNNFVKAFVYDDPRLNNYYALTVTFTPNASKTLATVTASATGDVKGGAFNILDQFFEANEYLRDNVGACSVGTCGSDTFTVTPRVTAYWKLGFNPAEYYGQATGISFYLPGYDRLFILGGVDGDYDSEDTDHFDNSVILHEFGHFLEDNLFVSDSPGGSHNGNKIIDPRLAWSEGWGNFFQAAVRNNPTYIDSEGNSDPGGSTRLMFYENLENQTGRDVPADTGEGNFREFSVSRNLWDALDNTPGENTNGGNDNINSAFGELWHGLTSTSGFLRPSAAFRQIGHFHEYHQSTMVGQGATAWTGTRTIERHTAATDDYAQYVTTTGSCSYAMSPSNLTSDGSTPDYGQFATSHLLLNNDFYHLRVTSAQSVTITLQYIDNNLAGTKADLDLYLYRESARYGNVADMADYSQASVSQPATAVETETVSAYLQPGNYLINVQIFTGNADDGGGVFYTLKLNGSLLCPANLP